MLRVWFVLAQSGAEGSGTAQPIGTTAAAALAADPWHFLAATGLKVVGALVIVTVGWTLAGWARRLIYRALNRPHFDQTLVRFLSSSARWALVAMTIVSCLTLFGVAPTSLAAVVGAAGLAVGLAMQGSLSNLAAGIMLLILRPFKVGDVIAVSGYTGTVDEIELFHTKLDTFDRRRVILPNGAIFSSSIENHSHHALRRVDVNVGVDYGADIDGTRRVLEAALASVDGVVAEPAPVVLLLNLGPSSVDWSVQAFAQASDLGRIKQDLIRAVKTGLDGAGIGIPFPQLDVWVRGQPGARAEGAPT